MAQASPSEGIYSQGDGEYLPGRDDSEVLSPGYTVGHYRQDHALADEAQALIDQMGGADAGTKARLQSQAQALIDQIYGVTLKGQMNQALDAAR